MGQGACTEALSKSGLVLSVYKTQNAIIYRGVHCKSCESKSKRKKMHVNIKTLVTCVIPTIVCVTA